MSLSDEEDLKRLVEAAIWAPSAGNYHAWGLVIVQRKEEIEQIRAVSTGMTFLPTAILILCQGVKSPISSCLLFSLSPPACF